MFRFQKGVKNDLMTGCEECVGGSSGNWVGIGWKETLRVNHR